MNWKHHLGTLAILIVAIVAYIAAPPVGGILLGVAMLLELVFWARLFGRRKAS